MKKIIIIGESHTRSFTYRQNMLPFFMGTGKEINLETKNIPLVNEKIGAVLSKINKEESLTFLFLGEPNCRLPIKNHWTPHWDEIRHGKKVIPKIDEQYLNKCIENLNDVNMEGIDYILTPTGAYDPVVPPLKYFNDLLMETYGDKVIDIFSNTIDENMKVLDSYKAKDWKEDPIHINSKISEDLITILNDKYIIDDVDFYKSDIDGYFGTHLVLKGVNKSNFGSYIIKD